MPIDEEKSIAAVLSEISATLIAIKDQQTSLQNDINRLLSQNTRPPPTLSDGLPELSIPDRSSTGFSERKPRPVSRHRQPVATEDMCAVRLIPYLQSTPVEEQILAKFEANGSSALEDLNILDKLSCLPPDDYRFAMRATRGKFVKELISSPIITRIKEIFKELNCFQDFQRQLGPGHFWVRDYDNYGSYTQWDCVDLPKVFTTDTSSIEKECKIPDSEWPLEWNTGHKTPVAPWRRIISCRGLSRVVDPRGPIRNPFLSEQPGQPASMHLHRQGRGQIGRKLTEFRSDTHRKREFFFQLTYVRCSTSSAENMPTSAWAGGSLYPGGLHSSMEYASITIDAVAAYPRHGDHPTPRVLDRYWTILFMEPVSWYDDLENILREAVTEESSMQIACLVLVSYALQIATKEWQKMALYFDTLLDSNSTSLEDSTLLNPEKHDRLLFEDEGFSRSRKYFWVIDALTKFIEEIEEAEEAWERYRAHEVDPFLQDSNAEEYDILLYHLSQAKSEVSRLEVVRRRLEKHLDRTKVLRDGLFNASGVIESRASTELGRNVRLLTYVSIFYLPLSFCASLWSTTNTFSWTNLAITMVLLSFFTYVFTFNLERLVRHAHDLYTSYKRHIVDRMGADLGVQSSAWADRAKRFDVFEPDRRSTKPTDWYVLWASVLLAGRWWRRKFWSGAWRP